MVWGKNIKPEESLSLVNKAFLLNRKTTRYQVFKKNKDMQLCA